MRKYFGISFTTFIFLMMTVHVKAGINNLPGDSSSLIGRWDITMNVSGKILPSWLEVSRSGVRTIVGQFVGPGGSARPISRINMENGKISFSIPPQWEGGKDNLDFEAMFQGDSLVGTVTFPDGKKNNFSAVKAPSLKRNASPSWSKPVQLINGKDLKGWHASGQTNQWIIENGILKSPKPGSNIITDAVFNDFKLHVEFRYSKGGNSGVYLRGRYEAQISDEEPGYPLTSQLGAIYGFLPPSENAGKNPGEWQSYDITLIGRMITVVLNGKTVICNREIPGITGGALDSHEAEPGPLMLQGDHMPIEYRNIVITPAK